MNAASRWRSGAALIVGFVVVTWGGFHNTAWSEDVPPPAAQDSGRSLEQRVKLLEEETAVKARENPKVTASAKDGFSIASPDAAFLLKLRALVQTDARFFIDDEKGNETDQFLVRRLRPILEGTVFKDFSFRLTPDFASNAKTTIFDAYLDYTHWNFAKLRIGKFKPPIGLEHLQSDENLVFAERGLPSDLVPSRDTGIQLFGDLFDGIVGYAAAYTNGVGDNNTNAVTTTPVASDTDNNDSKEETGHVFLKPFRRSEGVFQGIGFGVGGSYSKQSITNPTYNSIGQLALFTPAATAFPDGEKIRIATEFNWYCHSLGLFGEFIQSSQVYRVGSTHSRVSNQAWQGVASYVLTGEDAAYTGVKPRKPFEPKNGAWGAFELAVRYSVLFLAPNNFDQGVTTTATSVQRANDLGFGLNWYLNNNVRFTTDYDQTLFDQGNTGGADRPDEKMIISRAQLLF